MVISFVGAGSYVFGPSILNQLLDSELDQLVFRLIDPNLSSIQSLARAAQSELDRQGRTIKIECYGDIEGALADSNYVIMSAAPGMRSMFERNRQIIEEHYPEHLISEFGGVHGICYSVSQVRFMAKLAKVMQRECPNAWLFDSANPLPRICTAAARLGIRVAGFCSVAIVGYGEVLKRLDNQEESYPFSVSREKYVLSTAGTNHLSWVVSLKEKSTGKDITHELAQYGSVTSLSKSDRYLARTGYFLAPGDSHVQDFLEVDGTELTLSSSSHGSEAERAERERQIAEVVLGRANFSSLDTHPAWEHPIATIEALEGGENYFAQTLNLVNEGQIPNLPIGSIVEVPTLVTSKGFVPERHVLPDIVLPYNLLATQITDAIVNFGLTDDPAELNRAINLDPTIADKDRGRTTLTKCLESLT